MSVLKAAAVATGFLAILLGAMTAATELGSRGAVAPKPTPSLVTEPVTRSVEPYAVSTLAPVPPPTPSYNYAWDPNNPSQCFNPSDPNLPANAPRCPPRAVPPDPGGPIPICPTGYVAVILSGQPTCAKKAN